jgi:cyclophilin family peptidyl-prolyl cis-trans isomerase
MENQNNISRALVVLGLTGALWFTPELSASGATDPLFNVKKDGPLLTQSKRIKVQTSAGNLIFIMEPQWAPQTATQMTKLFQNHAFDGTEIPRYEPGFIFQISLAASKAAGQAPLTVSAQKLIRRIPLEVEQEKSGKLIHRPGLLSMARDDNDLSSNTSSFSILLGKAPHLDKKYTIFGRLSDDKENQETLEKMKSEWPKHPYIIKTISVK